MSKPLSAQVSIEDADFPALYRSADACSVAAQKSYLRLVFADLLLMVIGGFLTAINFDCASASTILAIVGGVLLTVSLVLTSTIGLSHFEKVWYGGRAVAESVRTLTWKFVCRATPFQGGAQDATADGDFARSLQQILEDRDYLGAELALASDGRQISDRMRLLRGQTLSDREAAYLASRIGNQRAWYARKASANKNSKARWFIAVCAAQLAAVAAAFSAVRWPQILGLAPAIATLATALLAWLQVRRHQELAQAYGIAAHELGLITIRADQIQDERGLSDFIQDAENAISREHTLWVARRDHI